MLFLCSNSQSFHLHTGGVSCFTTQAMTCTGSFRKFIVHGPWTGSKTVRMAENSIKYVLLTTWDRISIFFSANRARSGSQKLPLNVSTEWNFLICLTIAFITCNSNLVPLFEGLCSSNPCRLEFSVLWVFAGIEPTTSGLTVSRSDQLS